MMALHPRLLVPLRAAVRLVPCLKLAAAHRLAWLMLIPAFALTWTAIFLRHNNLEMQSIDLVHHAMFVDHLRWPWGSADPDFVGTYPLLSHRLAALAMPVYDNPIMAIRAAALTSLLVMFLAQWLLLRTLLPAAAAFLTMAAWQTLCTHCKLGNANHFLWEFQFNYSRAVAAAAFWVLLFLLARPPFVRSGWNAVLWTMLAAFAFACHIAPGTLAFGTLAAWWGVRALSGHWSQAVQGSAVTLFAAAAMLLGTESWRGMAQAAGDPGTLPVRHPDLIALWLPLAITAAGLLLARWRRRRLHETPLSVVLTCALIPAALLQAYMLYGKNITRTISSYPYNQMLMYTFGLASLWVMSVMIERYLGLIQPDSGLIERFRNRLPVLPAWSLQLAAAFTAGIGAYLLLETDARRERSGCDPVAVTRQLRPLRPQFLGHYFYDPGWEHASYYVTRCVLEGDAPHAAAMRNLIHHGQVWDFFARADLQGVFLPDHLRPAEVIGPGCPAERVGGFWKCDLAAYRQQPEFAARGAGVNRRGSQEGRP